MASIESSSSSSASGIDRQDTVLSTNIRTRLDGLSRSGEKAPDETHEHHSRHAEQRAAEAQQQALEQVEALVNHGRHVKVIATSPNPAKKGSYIVAGVTPKQSTGEDKPVAVCIDDNTTISKRTGEQVASTAVRDLQEGSILVVEGKQSKRGVIRAKRAIIV